MKNLEPKLRTRRISPKDLIWNDRGSGADADGSFWTYRGHFTYQENYKLLGDTLCGQPNWKNSPCGQMMLVEDNGDGILAKPIGSKKIWTDAGSGADRDVAVFRLIPPNEYICLGNVALGDYDTGDYPNLDRYRCVRRDYVEEAFVGQVLWTDRGSGAFDDFAGYSIDDTHTTETVGLFTTVSEMGSFILNPFYHVYRADAVYGLKSSKLIFL